MLGAERLQRCGRGYLLIVVRLVGRSRVQLSMTDHSEHLGVDLGCVGVIGRLAVQLNIFLSFGLCIQS